MPKTVILLNPMGVDVTLWMRPETAPFNKPLMGGTLVDGGDTLYTVPYVNQPGIANIDAGVDLLHTKLMSTAGDIVVFGYSEGCQVADKWLTVHGQSEPVPASRLSFLLIANANRKYGGFVCGHNVFNTVGYTQGKPADTPYQVTDFTRQYDGISDFPTAQPIRDALVALSSVGTDINYLTDAIRAIATVLNHDAYSWAAWNALAGAALVHNWYFDVTVDDPQNVELVEGNIRWVWSPTYPMPLVAGFDSQRRDASLRPLVESSYSRPVALLAPGGQNKPAPSPDAADLYGGSIERAAAAADRLADQTGEVSTDFVFSVHDKFWSKTGEIGGDLIEASGTDPWNDMPHADIKVKGGSDLVKQFMQCRNTMVGITVETAGLRWAFYVKKHHYKFEKRPGWESRCDCFGIWDVLNYLIIWPMWFMPIQAQPLSHAIFIGPLVTVIENMISECALRMQSGLMDFINNAGSLNLDMRTWIGTWLQAIERDGFTLEAVLNLLKTPIYVVRTNPLLDTSPLTARTVRMESCGTVIRELTKPYGVDVDVSLWMPGDPQPDAWANLTQPTYVVRVRDRSQIEGPTKTVIDSVLRTAVDVVGSLTDILHPLVLEAPGMNGVYIAPGIGVDLVEPYTLVVAPGAGEKSPLTSCEIVDHTPTGWQHIIGGRSPKWLNDIMNATFAWLIDSAMILIGFTGVPSDLLSGFLNNAFLAFQLIQHYDRRSEVGPYHPAMERFHATQSAPYNIETLFAFVNALFDSRGWTSAQATFRNGEGGLALGRDFFRGSLFSLVYPVPDAPRKMLTDYVMNIMWKVSPTERDVMAQIGDGQADEAPLAKHQRFLTALFEAYNVITLAPQS